MKLIYTHENRLLVSNVKNILENAGIAVTLSNEFVGSASGDISPLSTWPEVWVLVESDFDKAVQIVNTALSSDNNGDWICTECNETNSNSFELCWRCQTEHCI